MSTLLSVENLYWHIFNKKILNDISFTVSDGEILGIIGPNGAGKTSLLRCITGQVNHIKRNKQFGNIFLKERLITDFSAKELASHFAFVAQKTQAHFSLSVYDIVSMGLLPNKTWFAINNKQDEDNIIKAVETVGLSHVISKQYNQLSGGEQQRVLLARALVQRSQILVLDEPTNHLDVYYQHQILQLIKQLKLTVIMTVHDLNLASQYCHRLLLLDEGHVISEGAPSKVLSEELLTKVFRINCLQDIDRKTQKPRVYFYVDDEISHKPSPKCGVSHDKK
ncbi:MAG: ABC transporter ATP-binding protein [Colwellia sp.]